LFYLWRSNSIHHFFNPCLFFHRSIFSLSSPSQLHCTPMHPFLLHHHFPRFLQPFYTFTNISPLSPSGASLWPLLSPHPFSLLHILTFFLSPFHAIKNHTTLLYKVCMFFLLINVTLSMCWTSLSRPHCPITHTCIKCLAFSSHFSHPFLSLSSFFWLWWVDPDRPNCYCHHRVQVQAYY